MPAKNDWNLGVEGVGEGRAGAAFWEMPAGRCEVKLLEGTV